MQQIKQCFKSRKFIFLFSLILTLLIITISKIFTHHANIQLLLLPILSLMWGPFAVLGFVIAEFIYLIISYPKNLLLDLLTAIFLFISNFALWKLWYLIMNKDGLEAPNLNSLYKLIKSFVIFICFSIITYILFSFTEIGQINIRLKINIVSVATSYIILIFALFIANHFEIPMYVPQKQFKQILPEKIYWILFILFIILGILDIFYLNENYVILKLICIILLLIYLLKPYNDDISNIKQDIEPSIFNKINMSILLTIIILLIIITILNHVLNNVMDDPLTNILLNIFAMFVLMLIPLFVYLYFIERNLTKPINRLSGLLTKEITNRDDFLSHKNDLNSIRVNNEIKILIDSLMDMEDDLIKYGENLVKVSSEKERYETELKLASDIQNSMIPKDFEEFQNNFGENKDNFEFWGVMKAAREVGGDFYDYFRIDEDNIGFVIGDVSGKGVYAALIMVKSMTLIQDYAKQYKDLSKVFYEVNNNLCENNIENNFVTCWLGKINIKTYELSFVNAGHNPPLIKLNNGDFEYMDMQPGLVLAAMEDMPYKTHTVKLTREDMIFLYTDGVTEANDNYEEFYGEERLKAILNKHKNDDLSEIIKSVEEDVAEFCNYEEQFDDTTMFIFKIK